VFVVGLVVGKARPGGIDALVVSSSASTARIFSTLWWG
jgi:hypothetical protein